MGSKTKRKAEYGDFQTPETLARDVCALLRKHGLRPKSLLEPTCGLGKFLFAALDQFKEAQQALGADINAQYIKQAGTHLRRRQDAAKAQLLEADFFVTDWRR